MLLLDSLTCACMGQYPIQDQNLAYRPHKLLAKDQRMVDCYERKNNLKWVKYRLISFFFNFLFCLSQQTLLNAKPLYMYVASLVCAYIVMVIMGAVAFKTAGGSLFNIYRLTSQQTRRDY